MAITVEQRDEQFSVKQWKLWECEKGQALPAMEESYVDDWSSAIPKGFLCLKTDQIGIVDSMNHWRHPMEGEVYYELFDHFIDDVWHEARRKQWLWNAFLETYDIAFQDWSENISYASPMHDRHVVQARKYPAALHYLEAQQKLLSKLKPKQFGVWKLWMKSMMIKSDIPGEFAFATLKGSAMKKSEIDRKWMCDTMRRPSSLYASKYGYVPSGGKVIPATPKLTAKQKAEAKKKKEDAHKKIMQIMKTKIPEFVIEYENAFLGE